MAAGDWFHRFGDIPGVSYETHTSIARSGARTMRNVSERYEVCYRDGTLFAYTMPRASMASATRVKAATLAPTT
jgi:hypothetical protein